MKHILLLLLVAMTGLAGCGGKSAETWRTVWTESWDNLDIGTGQVLHTPLKCAGGTADPDLPPQGAIEVGANWTSLPIIGTLHVANNELQIDSFQTGYGYALLTERKWDHQRPLALTTTVDLQPDPYAWLGITLIADENDYRELSIYEWGGKLFAGIWQPCMVQWAASEVKPGKRKLRIEYTPNQEICWRHYIDDALVASEACKVQGAPLVGPARVGIYIVNLRAEGEQVPGYVRAVMGPIEVQQQ